MATIKACSVTRDPSDERRAKGRINAISISRRRGTRKFNIPSAELKVGFGIAGDAHGGNWDRQVSLLAAESIEKMRAKGAGVAAGDFAENICTEGIDLLKLTVGSKLRLGADAEVEITQFGKKCHQGCEILKQLGDCIMPREGVFAKVTRAGRIEVGDTVAKAQRNKGAKGRRATSDERGIRTKEQRGKGTKAQRTMNNELRTTNYEQ